MEMKSENYHTNGYASSFMNRLWKLAVSQSFTCDIILKHGWKHFYLHSSVLAVACPHLIQFLETKLEKHNFGHAEQLIMDLHSIASHQINIDTVNFVENNQKHNGFFDCESKFQKYSAEVLGLVWKFIYLGSIELTEDNVTEVENIANLLKQESLTRYCSDFKSRNMKKQDCSSQLPIVVCITTIPGEQDGPEDTPFHKRQPLPLLDTVTVNEVPSLDCGKDFLFTSQDSLENKTETNNTDMAHKEQCDVSSLAVQQAMINANSVSPIRAMHKDKNKTKTTKIGCLICTKLFSNINTLMKHLLKHKEDLLKCKYCNK
ncbi:unnamed protein product [Clavelina lepadiformis]|uniref:BTB domain-containing protein n=1 Tax=Clavelina lepadiformis TaxID=159417 RepID=A0ABP0GJZ1_CLALP